MGLLRRSGLSRYGRFAPIVNAGLLLALCLLATPSPASSLTVLAFGDSLTAGYGLGPGEAFPEQLERALRERGLAVTVRNSGVSGDTTAGGRARLGWALDGPVDLAIVELGANDGLRGIDPAETRRNLDAILVELKDRGIPVLLSGMLAPPNMGPDYGGAFNAIFPELAERHDVAFDPFFLEGVAARPALNQADGIHPNADGVARIVERLAPLVAAELAKR